MAEIKLRVTRKDAKGRYVSHNVKDFREVEKEILRKNRSYFFTPLIGYWRRKTLRRVMDELKNMAI